jgi:hypothetical protein
LIIGVNVTASLYARRRSAMTRQELFGCKRDGQDVVDAGLESGQRALQIAPPCQTDDWQMAGTAGCSCANQGNDA